MDLATILRGIFTLNLIILEDVDELSDIVLARLGRDYGHQDQKQQL